MKPHAGTGFLVLVNPVLHGTVGVVANSPDCSCGYSVNSTSDPSHTVFTEILETDFLRISSLIDNPCWDPQAYNVTAAEGHGEYGKMATPQNVISNPLRRGSNSMGIHSGDAGLQLWVNSTMVDGKVPMAEVVATNKGMAYGSFRVGMKITTIPGTCSAFFWYRNNTEEIDMEFLSSQFNASSHPAFLVMQTPPKPEATQDAPTNVSTYAVIELPFVPEEDFHEYRFDWTPDGVSFYADGEWIHSMSYVYADAPGHLALNHWSNGNKKWSEGPPGSDAVTTISYVKAYFNSSDPTRQAMYDKRCASAKDEKKICQIPDQVSGTFGIKEQFFFSSTMCGEQNPTSTMTTNSSTSHSKTLSSSKSYSGAYNSTSSTKSGIPTNTAGASASSGKLSSGASTFTDQPGFTLDVPSFFKGFGFGLPLGLVLMFGM